MISLASPVFLLVDDLINDRSAIGRLNGHRLRTQTHRAHQGETAIIGLRGSKGA